MAHRLTSSYSKVKDIEFPITWANHSTVHQGNPPQGTTTSKLIITRKYGTPPRYMIRQFNSK